MEERTIVIIEGKKEDRRGYTWNKFIKGQGQEKREAFGSSRERI